MPVIVIGDKLHPLESALHPQNSKQIYATVSQLTNHLLIW